MRSRVLGTLARRLPSGCMTLQTPHDAIELRIAGTAGNDDAQLVGSAPGNDASSVRLLELQVAEQELELAALRASGTAAARDAARQHRMMRRFAHDLRTPLSAIQAWTAVLSIDERRPAAGEPQWAKGLAAISRNAGIQSQVIDRFLQSIQDGFDTDSPSDRPSN